MDNPNRRGTLRRLKKKITKMSSKRDESNNAYGTISSADLADVVNSKDYEEYQSPLVELEKELGPLGIDMKVLEES